jgi:hypothetical protein
MVVVFDVTLPGKSDFFEYWMGYVMSSSLCGNLLTIYKLWTFLKIRVNFPLYFPGYNLK